MKKAGGKNFLEISFNWKVISLGYSNGSEGRLQNKVDELGGRLIAWTCVCVCSTDPACFLFSAMQRLVFSSLMTEAPNED